MQQNFTHKSVLESSCSDLNVSGTIIDTDNGTFNDLDSSEVFLPNTDFLDEEWSKIDNKSRGLFIFVFYMILPQNLVH